MFEEITDYYEINREAEGNGMFLIATDKLVLDTLSEQFINRNNEILKLNNILDDLEEKFKFLKIKYADSGVAELEAIERQEMDLYWKIFEFMKLELGFTYNRLSDKTNLDLQELKYMVQQFYEFFFVDYKNNLKSFFFSYLYKNKKEIANGYKDELKKKDLEYFSNKKDIDISSFIIIKFCSRILKDFLSIDLTPQEVLEHIFEQDPEESNYIYIRELLRTGSIVLDSDFNESFFLPLWNLEQRSNLACLIGENFMKMELSAKSESDREI